VPADVVRDQYDARWASHYEAWQAGKPRWARETQLVSEMLAGEQGPLLDVPVGTGRFASLYRSIPALGPILGVDTSEPMMAVAAMRGLPCRRGDAMALDLESGSFDVAVCVRLLNHFNEREMQRAVGELLRVTRRTVVASIHLGEPYDTGKNWTIHRPEAFVEALGGARIVRMGRIDEKRGRPYWMVKIRC
jgi:ubiquinone/menaquinone biosynthesis C-methylase UbiE